MKNALWGFVFILALLLSGCSEKTVVSDVKNGVKLESDSLNLIVQFYSEDIVRVIKWNRQGKMEKKSLMVIGDSLPDIKIEIDNSGKKVTLASTALSVIINKKDGSIEYINNSKNTLLKESGIPLFEKVTYGKDNAFHIKQSFKLTSDEGVYGLGQHQSGFMNYRNREVVLLQANTEAVIPFLVSTNGYGILWDNYSKTVFSDLNHQTSFWSDVADNIDYYFIAGSSMDKVIAGYRTLTGQAPMYGKWAYGYWQSKEHYDTQAEITSVAMKYRKLQIPIDNMIQDWDYWNGAANWGGMFFDKTLFPKPKEMVDLLHKNNFHMIISIWPALGPNTAIYKDMLSKGFLYKPVGWAGFKYYDAFNPEANKLYCDYLNKGLYIFGIDGWWIDSTEPDIINALTKGSTEYEMKKVEDNFLGSWARYINAFSLSMTDAVYKNMRQQTDKQRAYILTRSVYAGQQRNAATTWSGDIGASWEIYKKQISAGVNHCMAGVPYWTFDIGGFVLGAYEGTFSTGGKDASYQELYTRMFQFGAFCPIFRSHGSETPREIWEFGDFSKTLIKFDNLRYRLMPYIYSLAWKVTNDGYTIMRGLPMDFTIDKNTYSIDDQFMFGPAFMACPVTEYMYNRPPEASIEIAPKYFKTDHGKQGLKATYCKDPEHKTVSLGKIDSNIHIFWYTGRPEYATDSMYSIRWKGKLIPDKTGKHQFHLLCFDKKRIFLNGKELKMIYTSTEQYSEYVNLEAGKEYDFVFETENTSTGASRVILRWKTPDMFEREKIKEEKEKTRKVYLPASTNWVDFWTGKSYPGGQTITTDAPIDIMPLFVKAGSIVPMGPFVQYATEKPADTLEIRIYPGANGSFTLYEDENDNYNYEKGMFSTIDFAWNDQTKELTVGKRIGQFPGMLKEKTLKIILVSPNMGTGVEVPIKFNQQITYKGEELKVKL